MNERGQGEVGRGAGRDPERSTLDRPRFAAETTPLGERSAAPPASGERFGPYEVLGRLGRGGMGEVFEVRHAQTGIRYALKTVTLGCDLQQRERVRLRFRREAELSARLRHEGILKVHTGQLDGERPYLVVDLLTGGSLAERVERGGPLPLQAAVKLGYALSDALRSAHAAGVVHRDLKPENVLFNERGQPVLVDFGLAVSLRQDTLRPTRPGEILGTPLQPSSRPSKRAVRGATIRPWTPTRWAGSCTTR